MASEKSGKQLPQRATLTSKETRLLFALTHARNQSEAAHLAGYRDSPHIRQTAHRAIERIKRKFPELLDEMGITAEAAVYKHLVPLMNAETVKFLKNGTQFVRLPDNATRLRALHIYCMLAGLYAPKGQITQEAVEMRGIVVDVPRPRLPETNGHAKNGGGK
jgi:hypothetical protein